MPWNRTRASAMTAQDPATGPHRGYTFLNLNICIHVVMCNVSEWSFPLMVNQIN